MNTSVVQSSAQSRLPALDKQNIKFAHFRYKAVPLVNDEAKFFNLVELPNYEVYCTSTAKKERACVFPYGGVTAAFKINPDDGIVEVGLSKCSILDIYNKHTGRMISQGRFTNAKHPHVRFPSLIKFNIGDADKLGIKTEDRNASSIARDLLVAFLNSSNIDDVDDDMSHIRAYTASCSPVPFIVELS